MVLISFFDNIEDGFILNVSYFLYKSFIFTFQRSNLKSLQPELIGECLGHTGPIHVSSLVPLHENSIGAH